MESIKRIHAWATELRDTPDMLGEVARFVLSVLDSPEMPADLLAAIQRSFQPIDDDGTLRMEVKRSDVEALLCEVVRLRAGYVCDPGGIVVPADLDMQSLPVVTTWYPIVESEGTRRCPAPTVPAANGNAAPSEPALPAMKEFDTSDADTVTTALPE